MTNMVGAVQRRTILAALGGAALALPLRLHAQAAGDYRIAPEPVADGIWVVRGVDGPIEAANGGAIANIGIIDTPAGTVLLDVGPSHRYGAALKARAEALTGKPVIRIYITHLHPDHDFGLGAFPPSIAAALPETIAEIQQDGSGFSDGMYRILGDWMRGTDVVLPTIRITPGVEDFGGRKLRIIALAGHSAADLCLLDEATGTVFTGDLVFNNRAPTTPDADVPVWLKSLDTLAALPHRILVPGHGPVDSSGQGAIAQTRDWLMWLESTLKQAVAQGLDMVEAGNLPIPDRFQAIAAARYELQRSIVHLYPGIEATAFPRIDQPG